MSYTAAQSCWTLVVRGLFKRPSTHVASVRIHAHLAWGTSTGCG